MFKKVTPGGSTRKRKRKIDASLMNPAFSLLMLCLCFQGVYSQSPVSYTLYHTTASPKIAIHIDIDPIPADAARLIIPRSAPGTYSLTDYLPFVDQVRGLTAAGGVLEGAPGDGSYFSFSGKDQQITGIRYEVDVRLMEERLLDGSSSSKMRNNYLGILGYSVFGYIAGQEDRPIALTIETQAGWPIFSTLRPAVERHSGRESYRAGSYALLADAQFMLGPGVEVAEVTGAPIPLYAAVYAERAVEDLEAIGKKAETALRGLSEYFGYIPMPHYTLCFEYLVPMTGKHQYGFSMEHLNSMTASRNASDTLAAAVPLPGIVHHMGHSWIPLRCYGAGYRPFEWQIAPTIETIWLNEGFIWYIAYYSVLKRPQILDVFRQHLAAAPDFITQLSLRELSRLGSTQYSLDFRIGKNLFSRGALLAHDLDVHIQRETQGRKSFKDAVLGLLEWTATHQRAFGYDDIEPILSAAVGVPLKGVWEAWQGPVKK